MAPDFILHIHIYSIVFGSFNACAITERRTVVWQTGKGRFIAYLQGRLIIQNTCGHSIVQNVIKS